MVSNAVKELQASKNNRLATIRGLEKEIAQLDHAIASLSGICGGPVAPVTTPITPKKFVMSPAHQKALKKAQQLRWASHNAAKAATTTVAAKPAKKKTMSAAARKKLSDFQKKLWAARKAKAAKKK